MTKKTDMSETRTAETDMTETLEPEFVVIWLRRQACFSILHTWDCDTVKNNDQKIGESQSYLCNFGSRRLSRISVNGKLGVSVISLQTLVQASQSYQSQGWTLRLTHIDLDWIGLAQSY